MSACSVNQVAKPNLPIVEIRSAPFSRNALRVRLYNNRLWRLCGHSFERSAVWDPIDLSDVSEEKVCSCTNSDLGVLFHIVTEPEGNGAAVPFNLTTGLQVIRGCEQVLDP